MAKGNPKGSPLAKLLSLGSLILLLILLGLYFENCFRKDLSLVGGANVLGVTSFSSAGSKSTVLNSETFNFTSTVVGDQTGVLNATVLFTLSGPGVLGSNIQGPGACLKLTSTTATCNNVNIDPNETITWTVPVTANSSCSPSSISLGTQLVATVEVTSTTASVNCVSSLPSTSTAPVPTTTSGQGSNLSQPINITQQGGTGTTTNTRTTGSGNDTQENNSGNFDLAGFACTRINGFPLVFILFILWLIATAYYFLFRKR